MWAGKPGSQEEKESAGATDRPLKGQAVAPARNVGPAKSEGRNAVAWRKAQLAAELGQRWVDPETGSWHDASEFAEKASECGNCELKSEGRSDG